MASEEQRLAWVMTFKCIKKVQSKGILTFERETFIEISTFNKIRLKRTYHYIRN